MRQVGAGGHAAMAQPLKRQGGQRIPGPDPARALEQQLDFGPLAVGAVVDAAAQEEHGRAAALAFLQLDRLIGQQPGIVQGLQHRAAQAQPDIAFGDQRVARGRRIGRPFDAWEPAALRLHMVGGGAGQPQFRRRAQAGEEARHHQVVAEVSGTKKHMSDVYMHGTGPNLPGVSDRVFTSTRQGRVLPRLFYAAAAPFLPPRLDRTRQILPIPDAPKCTYYKNQELDRYISMACRLRRRPAPSFAVGAAGGGE